jgi:hypothetical protein
MLRKIFGGVLVGAKLWQRRLGGRKFFLHKIHLLAAVQPAFIVFHITGSDHSDHAFRQPAKDHKRQPAIEGFAKAMYSP